MLGHLGFSYIGLIFLIALFIPNIIWIKKFQRDILMKMKIKFFYF